MIRIYAVAAVTAMVALLGGLWWYATMAPPRSCAAGQVAGGDIGGPFTLVSETGETVTDADVLTKPSLVYFGYTFCPDVCPLDAARNAAAVDLLAEDGYDVQPVFVTIDPARDTPEVLTEFTDYMHPDMLGLTGSEQQVKDAAKAYRVYFSKREGDDPEYYLMDHSVFTYLMLPGNRLAGFFRGAPGASSEGLEAAPMAEQVSCLLDEAGAGRD